VRERLIGATRLAVSVMKHRMLGVAAALLSAFVGTAQAAKEDESSIEQSADKLLIGIPAAAFGLTFLLSQAPDAAPGFRNTFMMNGSPRHDLGLALMRAGAVTYSLKYTVKEERPNGEDDSSFPSGHTAITFAGAEFIRKEYGWAWGAPAYAAAAFVGWSRVATDDHWGHDVAAGAAIGILSNYDFGLRGVSVKPALLRAVDVAPGAPQVPEMAPGLRFEKRF